MGLQSPACFCYAMDMTDPKPTRRRFYPTPAWLIYGLLGVEGLLWLSERYRWFPFNEKKGWTVLIGVAVVGGAMLVMLLWFAVSLLFRWRFQFSIRSLLVLTVAVAVPCSWMAVEMREANWQREVIEKITKSGGSIRYDREVDATANPPVKSQPWVWLSNTLGGDFFEHVVDATIASDDDLKSIAGFCQLRRLRVPGTRFMGHPIYWNGTPVTSAPPFTGPGSLNPGMERSEEESRSVWRIRVTDDGLCYLKRLTRLKSLGLGGSKVTDAGLEHLEGLTQLQALDLTGTKVTDEGVTKLQQALPKCKIER